MTKIIIAFLLFSIVKESSAQGKIFVTIRNFRNNKGVCKACLFKDAGTFAGNGPAFKCKEVKIQKKKVNVTFETIPWGIYAIAVFHDENNNNEIDKNFFGMPKEAYGASKNRLPFAGAPTFIENKFQVVDTCVINIKIRLRKL